MHLGRTNGDLCPVSAILAYMVQRGPEKRIFLLVHKESLPNTGAFDVSNGSGTATDRDRCCWPQLPYWGNQNSSLMWSTRFTDKNAGRWENTAYTVYIQTPKEKLCLEASSLIEHKM